ncbi:hypothetical protein DOTSEDRAFT_27026 [Dothistroma septosporum NZE10]|uniref:Uncharacterized protein n=1 Tax=Dothistroma septosporum (strain NZE10 / CBS 128990) TaxID=675120 RepID=N1PK29_DOTSN|nr:hypothetical protein DOTSEDRAFT_27026 [Dothistroma septosporum NZE10]
MSSITDLGNVQGDILLQGLNKEVETFAFFTIPTGQESAFARALRNVAQQEITSTQNVLTTQRTIKDFRTNLQPGAAVSQIPTVGANISFTFNGLQKISKVVNGLDIQSLNTGSFNSGMKTIAVGGLQDPIKPGTATDPVWADQWLNNKLDGVLLVAGQTTQLVQDKLNRITQLLGPAAKIAFKLDGNVRPGDQRGKEHFGYHDGISQPIVGGLPGLTKDESYVPPGQDTIDQGVILCGRPGDLRAQNRPQWMLDGSFLVFRQLKQNVQDWNNFLQQGANDLGVFKDQLGARLIGRWKSGCPVNLQADFDDVNIGKDKMRNNLFDFDPQGLDKNSLTITPGMRLVCPIGAHIRKTNPRGDQFGPNSDPRKNVSPHRILRRGIPYGPEISQNPTAERGLLFACYQSDLEEGFDFIQQNWANHPFFRFAGAGIDAVMGQSNSGASIGMKGLFPQDANRELQLPGINRFVVPRGGEYFFSPSISTMAGVMSNVAANGVANGVNGNRQMPLAS